MVAAARRNAPAADCQQGDAQNLPYGDNTFDAVVCGYGIMHLPEPDRALAEMRRVLRPRWACCAQRLGRTLDHS